jgi:hypothetical protein
MRQIQPVYDVNPYAVLGRTHLPTTAQVFGAVKHPHGGSVGALVRLQDGTFMHITEGCIRELPADAAAEAAAKLAN